MGGGRYTIAIPMSFTTLLLAMDEAYDDINSDQCQAWIRHAKSYFTRCMNNIHFDVDENLWPNAQNRLDANECVLKVLG
jgi:hypothetical protein